MKKLTMNLIKQLKIRHYSKDSAQLLTRGEAEVTVELEGAVVTGKPADIAIFMAEMILLNQK